MAFAGFQHDHAAGANEKDSDLGKDSKSSNNHDEFAALEAGPTAESQVFQPPPLVREMTPERRIQAEAALKRKIGIYYLSYSIIPATRKFIKRASNYMDCFVVYKD